MIKLIIFDFDGPILDSFGAAKNSVVKTSQKLNLPILTKENFVLSWGYPGAMAVKKLFPGITQEKAELFVATWAENEKQKRLPLVRGARETLAEIKRNFLIALLTARSHNLKFHFQELGLEKYFDFFQSFENPALPKEKAHPNHIFHPSPKDGPDFFNNLFAWMKEKNVLPAESIFIDDTLAGLKLVKKVGLPFLGVCTGPLSSKKDWLRYGNLDGKYVINSIAELPEWLDKNVRV